MFKVDFKDKFIINTDDGSNTIFVPQINESYHSTKGAIGESLYVYIKQGLEFWLSNNTKKNEIKILEIGMGTGLNILLTYIYFLKSKINIKYTALEPYPMSIKFLTQLNYIKILKNNYNLDLTDIFQTIHGTRFAKKILLYENKLKNKYFIFSKINKKVQDYHNRDFKFDLIYFDAFAPKKQSDIWDIKIFDKLYNIMNYNSILVTYSANVNFRKNLKKIGYKDELLKGALGKLNMSRASKI